jgi:nucleotide-binding universal stress UspA family protein
MKFSNILVPTDGSELTKAAVAQAVELAKVTGGKITALYVVDQAIFVNMPLDSAVMNVYTVLEEEGKNAVKFVEDLCAKEGVGCELKVVEGTPVKAIIDLSSKFDLIVMGSLGRTGMSKLLMGSVAEKVVRGALCPVMVVKSPEVE